jgi:uncharacterized membrane protein
MELLVAGVLLWSIVHLFPGLATGARLRLIDGLGQGAYRGIYSLLIVIAIACMVFGWRAATPTVFYTPPAELRIVTAVLMLIALVLFVSSRPPTDIKRVLRHPQLTGVLMWGIAHLLSNGDSRSLLLFGGLGLWAIVEMIVIDRREGTWVRPQPVGVKRSAVPFVIGAIAWFVLFFVHPWIAGVSLLPAD